MSYGSSHERSETILEITNAELHKFTKIYREIWTWFSPIQSRQSFISKFCSFQASPQPLWTKYELFFIQSKSPKGNWSRFESDLSQILGTVEGKRHEWKFLIKIRPLCRQGLFQNVHNDREQIMLHFNFKITNSYCFVNLLLYNNRWHKKGHYVCCTPTF